jgi:hypothetical protein
MRDEVGRRVVAPAVKAPKVSFRHAGPGSQGHPGHRGQAVRDENKVLRTYFQPVTANYGVLDFRT